MHTFYVITVLSVLSVKLYFAFIIQCVVPITMQCNIHQLFKHNNVKPVTKDN